MGIERGKGERREVGDERLRGMRWRRGVGASGVQIQGVVGWLLMLMRISTFLDVPRLDSRPAGDARDCTVHVQ